MKALRIALVVPGLPVSSGGPSVSVPALAARLCDVGHEVTIVTADLSPGGGPPDLLAEVDKRVNVQLFQVWSWWDRRLYRSVELGQWMNRATDDFDVVDIHGVWSFTAVDAAHACLQAGTPYILTPHGQMAKWDWTRKTWQKWCFFSLLLQKVWDSAAAIRFLSAGEITGLKVKTQAQSVIIPNAVVLPEESDGHHDTKGFRREIGIPENAPVILFLGRVTAQKGVLELIEAFDHLWQRRHDAVLLLVGPLDEKYSAAVAERVNRLPSRRSIYTLGPVYDKRKYGILATASLFVTLSKNEGLPIAALEAMAWGLPVVLTHQANLPEVPKYNAGVVIAANPTEVGSMLEDLLSNTAELRQMGKNARKLIQERFTWEKILPQILSLYERVAREREQALLFCSRCSAVSDGG